MLESSSQFLMAQQYFNLGEFKKAFLNLIHLSSTMSHDVDYLRLMAQVQNKLNDQSARLKTLKVLAEKSLQISDKLDFMLALYKQGRRNESLDEALKLTAMSSLSQTERTQVLKNLIHIYTAENDFEGLKEVCDELLNMNVIDPEIDYSLAVLSAAQGDLDQAISFIRKAVTLDPKFDSGWTALGLYHFKKGDIELAKANLEKALDVNAAQPAALKYMAHWVEPESKEQIDATLTKINYYLQKFNFDEEISECHASLLIKRGHEAFAHLEAEKLSYYFGK